MKQGTKVTKRALRVLAAGAITVGVLGPSAAFAANYPDGGATTTTPRDAGAQVEAATTNQSGSSSLPFTGGDVAGLAAIGGGAVVIGGLLAHRARRSRA